MLGYCTNVHSGSSFKDVLSNLRTHCHAVQQQLSHPIGIGLWLSDVASREVDIPLLQDTLSECELTVFTMNGFPFSDFHEEIVQHKVYEPNWCDERRLDYTIRLAKILASIIEVDEASISTLPLGWNSASFANEDAAKVLLDCIMQLEELEQQTGRCIHLNIETEPGCRLQTSNDLSQFFNTYFKDDERSRRYLRVCHDTCHAAVMRETPEEAVSNYEDAGISIGKVQLSSAIEVDFSNISQTDEQPVKQALVDLAEPRYLHQTTIDTGSKVTFFDNLSDALLEQLSGLWRIHFHIPIHLQHFGALQTTQDDLLRSIPVLKSAGVTEWEVETYTWSVTPSSLQEGELVDSIVKELTWAATHINQ